MFQVQKRNRWVTSVQLLTVILSANLAMLLLILPVVHGASGDSRFEQDWATLVTAAQKEGRLLSPRVDLRHVSTDRLSESSRKNLT